MMKITLVKYFVIPAGTTFQVGVGGGGGAVVGTKSYKNNEKETLENLNH